MNCHLIPELLPSRLNHDAAAARTAEAWESETRQMAGDSLSSLADGVGVAAVGSAVAATDLQTHSKMIADEPEAPASRP